MLWDPAEACLYGGGGRAPGGPSVSLLQSLELKGHPGGVESRQRSARTIQERAGVDH